MINVEFPTPAFQVKELEGKEWIFDSIRKQWVRLTPEEWVRQNFIQYLTDVNGYSSSFISVEKEMTLGELKKRFDILVFDRNHQPWMMVECKAMDVPLSEQTFQQLIQYHMSIPVPYLVITNGGTTRGWYKEQGQLKELEALPSFPIST